MKKFLLPGIALTGATLGLLSHASSAETLRVGESSPASSAIMPVAVGVEMGIFAKYGLDIKLTGFSGGSKLFQGMIAMRPELVPPGPVPPEPVPPGPPGPVPPGPVPPGLAPPGPVPPGPPVSPDWAVASRRGGGVIVPVPPGISGSAVTALSPSWPGSSIPGEPVIAGSPIPRSSFIVSEPNAGPLLRVRSAGGMPTPAAASRPVPRPSAGAPARGAAGPPGRGARRWRGSGCP